MAVCFQSVPRHAYFSQCRPLPCSVKTFCDALLTTRWNAITVPWQSRHKLLKVWPRLPRWLPSVLSRHSDHIRPLSARGCPHVCAPLSFLPGVLVLTPFPRWHLLICSDLWEALTLQEAWLHRSPRRLCHPVQSHFLCSRNVIAWSKWLYSLFML